MCLSDWSSDVCSSDLFVPRLFRNRTVRPRNVRMANTVLALDRHADSAFAKLVAGAARRAQTKRSLAALQVRHTHAGKQYALNFLRRKRNRDANHRSEERR